MKDLVAKVVRPELALVLVAAFAVVRVVDTYDVFTHTWDEPAHLAAGLELLDLGTYTLELQHPPLARAAMAVGPYLAGRHSERPVAEKHYDFWERQLQMFDEGRRLLYDAGPYQRVLSLARMGNLPFLLIALVATYLWARRLMGPWPGVLAAFLLASVPPFLGHAGLATLDVAVAALGVASLFAFCRWLERPGWGSAIVLGVTAGLAVMSKFSAIPFLVVGWLAISAWRLWLGARDDTEAGFPSWTHVRTGVVTAATMLLVFHLSYGFSMTSIADPDNRPYQSVERVFGADTMLTELVSDVLELPVMPGFVPAIKGGIDEVLYHNRTGHVSYLLGEVSKEGWWNFYLVVLGVKTPPALLILGVGGVITLLTASHRRRDWRLAAPAVAVLSLLLFVSLYSRINLGVRHVLIVYPLLAIAGAHAVTQLVRGSGGRRMAGVAVAGLLVAWQTVSSLWAQPDNMAYFNGFAGSHPERVLVVGDLDWGQDLGRLKRELDQRGIRRVAIAYYGSARPLRHGITGYVPLEPDTPVTGWVAISLWKRLLTDDYDWLDAYQPVTRVGTSIDLYHVPPSPAADDHVPR